jgi:ABC-type transport system substrate-binding protein
MARIARRADTTGRRLRRARRTAGTAVAGIAAVAVLAACGGGSGKAGSTSGGAASAGDASSSSGALKWYGQGLPTSWDPIFSSAGHDVGVLSLAYTGLTRLNTTGGIEPDLATSWTFSDHDKALTFTLKPGLTFADGTPVDAAAVKVNLDRARTATGSLVASLLTAISSETVVSKDVVRLNLNRVDLSLPLTLAGKAGFLASPAVIQKDPASLATKPVGAGPFRLTGFVPDGDATFVKFPGYWDASDIHIGSVYLSGVTTAATVLAALQSGQSNLAVIQGSQVAAAKSDGFAVKVIPTFAVTDIEVNNTKKPFTNPLIVKAVGYALNRPSLAQSQTFGYGKPDDEPEPPGYLAYDPAYANYYSYNPAKAKQLLAQAGYPGGKGLTVEITTSPPPQLAEAIQAQLQAVGITVTINTIPATESTTLVYVDHEEAFATSGFAGREAPIDMLNLGCGADGLLNPGRNAPAELTRALTQAATVPVTSSSYAPTIQHVTGLCIKDDANLFLYNTPLILAYPKTLTGLQGYIDYEQFQGVRIGS